VFFVGPEEDREYIQIKMTQFSQDREEFTMLQIIDMTATINYDR